MNFEPFHSVLNVAGLLADFHAPWYIAGGWAIDLYLQQCRRTHKDVDIAIFRRDQLGIQKNFLDRGMKVTSERFTDG